MAIQRSVRRLWKKVCWLMKVIPLIGIYNIHKRLRPTITYSHFSRIRAPSSWIARFLLRTENNFSRSLSIIEAHRIGCWARGGRCGEESPISDIEFYSFSYTGIANSLVGTIMVLQYGQESGWPIMAIRPWTITLCSLFGWHPFSFGASCVAMRCIIQLSNRLIEQLRQFVAPL